MTGEETMKYVIYGLDGDPELPMLAAAVNNADMGPLLISIVGSGNPFYAFESVPSAILLADELGANFNGAPLCSSDEQTNRLAVAAQYAAPVAIGAENNGTNKVWVVA